MSASTSAAFVDPWKQSHIDARQWASVPRHPSSQDRLDASRAQQSHYSDHRSSFASQFPGASGPGTSGKLSNERPAFRFQLHFLGLSGLPQPGCLERTPKYEFFLQVGSFANRFEAFPLTRRGENFIALEEFVPPEQLKGLQRLDQRVAISVHDPGDHFRLDVYEEKAPLLDIWSKGYRRYSHGTCYVPIDEKYNRRPCCWPICGKDPKTGEAKETGYVMCKYLLTTVPGPVRNLRCVEGTIGASEVQLAWDPPLSDGGAPLQNYRIRVLQARPSTDTESLFGHREDTRTAFAPPASEPSVVMRSLQGNTDYTFCVWAITDAGQGARCEITLRTGAVEPGPCGLPRLVPARERGQEALYVEWTPPTDTGGAPIVAYRVWLRPLFQSQLGEAFPAEGWMDLGLFEHRGDPEVPQRSPLRLEALPPCSGCLCSIAALNSAGQVGPATEEVEVLGTRSAARPFASVPPTATSGIPIEARTYKRVDLSTAPTPSLAAVSTGDGSTLRMPNADRAPPPPPPPPSAGPPASRKQVFSPLPGGSVLPRTLAQPQQEQRLQSQPQLPSTLLPQQQPPPQQPVQLQPVQLRQAQRSATGGSWSVSLPSPPPVATRRLGPPQELQTDEALPQGLLATSSFTPPRVSASVSVPLAAGPAVGGSGGGQQRTLLGRI